MKRLLTIGALALLLGMTVLSFLPGYGPSERDYQDESAGVIGPLSYFKTPESAVLTIALLIAEENWTKLSQFYEQGPDAPDYQTLLDGSYFRAKASDRAAVRPFAPELVWLDTTRTDDEDIYEIAVGLNKTGSPVALKTFYLKRYPRGYRILAYGGLPNGGTRE